MQIVVGTYDKADFIDSTKIFNTYGVGKNNLGILLLMGYQKVNDEYVFSDLLFEIGTKMSTYLSAFEMSGLITAQFYNYGDPDDYDMKIVNLYYELIELTAIKIYDYDQNALYNNFLNSEDYYFDQYQITKKLDSEKFSLLSFQAFILVFAILIFIGSSGFNIATFILTSIGISSAKGGGGKSAGYYARK